jgi:hypothetical protein
LYIFFSQANVLGLFRLDNVKESILEDLKETWFISHIQIPSHGFIDWNQSAIEK